MRLADVFLLAIQSNDAFACHYVETNPNSVPRAKLDLRTEVFGRILFRRGGVTGVRIDIKSSIVAVIAPRISIPTWHLPERVVSMTEPQAKLSVEQLIF